MFVLFDLIYLVLEVKVSKIDSPQKPTNIHGFFAILEVIEEKDINTQDAPDGNKVPE